MKKKNLLKTSENNKKKICEYIKIACQFHSTVLFDIKLKTDLNFRCHFYKMGVAYYIKYQKKNKNKQRMK